MFILQTLQAAIQNTDLPQISDILADHPALLEKIDDSNATLFHWIIGDENNHIEDPLEIVTYLLDHYDIDIITKQQLRMALRQCMRQQRVKKKKFWNYFYKKERKLRRMREVGPLCTSLLFAIAA